ncbi:DUF2442 domain-containing protein [Iamia sp.]|uniref:DUF2442 domain-containing protein n=1 Tax=Iamia sp. TaxID=2722710 RepID=UPI002B5C2AF7|nr:DUF2442 domain-containing protein [Iamia sp.]HXH56372.1 DUF2442 domain-containing protein [Iamia sp.]
MAGLARVTDVKYLGERVLRIVFSDGLVRELDFAEVLSGVLAAIDDDAMFAAVEVDDVAGTVCWPSGIDFDPDVLHGDNTAATGHQPNVVRAYRLEQTR